MSFIGKGQDGQVPVASGNSIVWEEPAAAATGVTSAIANDSNNIIASQIFSV